MTQTQLLLVLLGIADILVVGWIVTSSLKEGNISGPRGIGAKLIYRDEDPITWE